MAEHPHSEHRPPPAGEEAGFHNPGHFGVLYPVDDFVAVIYDWESAQHAVQALRALGIPAEDIDLLDNARARALEREATRQLGLSERVQRTLSRVFSDDAAYQQSLDEAVRAGGSIVIVHVTDDATVHAVGEIMLAHDARESRYYRQGEVEDLI